MYLLVHLGHKNCSRLASKTIFTLKQRAVCVLEIVLVLYLKKFLIQNTELLL